MKKNKIMRLASVLLIAVLLSTSIISGTFAKYVTTGSVSDSARVAKFGVVVTGSGSLFAQNYWAVNEFFGNSPSDHTNYPNPDMGNEAVLSVESSNGNKLVAPGTQNGTGVTLAVTGTPEVDVKITLAIDADYKDIVLPIGEYLDMTTSDNNWDKFSITDADYHPLVFTLKNGNGVTIVEGTLADVKWYLDNVYSLDVDANTDLNAPAYTYTLTWKWAFEGEQWLNGKAFDAKTVDQADTFLGDMMALRMNSLSVNDETLSEILNNYLATEGLSLDVSVKLSLTVTQVD